MAIMGWPEMLLPAGLMLATLVYYGIIQSLIQNFDGDVRVRFLEHSAYIPSLKAKISLESLRTWFAGDAARRGSYAAPVIFPLDAIFLVLLGFTLVVVSVYSARFSIAREVASSWWYILPGAYVVADACEDVLIFCLCKCPDWLSSNSFSTLRFFTAAKKLAVTAAFAQTVILIVIGPILRGVDEICVLCGFS